jgi:predicted dehydrogenase/SAM-dependent methyltransferase
MASIVWGREIAEVHDEVHRAKFEPSVLGPMVDLLAELAGGGPALEFAVGTGRVALPLSARGIEVRGLELSPHMAERLLAKPGAGAVPVTIGDMTTTRVVGAFTLVYLVANTIMNVTTQDDQLAVFANATVHLEPGGCFVVEVIVPQLRRVPPGETARVLTLDPDHVGIETFDDLVGQIAWSHHWFEVGGRLVRHSAPYRYVWPSELDLMAKLAGLRLRDRWAGWDRAPFASDSLSQVAVFEKSLNGRSPAVPAPVRIGLVGYGLGGRYYHAPLIASAANCDFLGVVTTSPERRREVGEDLGRPAFDSLEDLVGAGAEAVAISTPFDTHVTLTQQALRLGLAVVCDKPFAPDADAARATVELAEELDVPLTVYQNRRWDSDFLTLRELLERGSLGALTVFESRFERFRPEHGPHAAGGGTLMDFGSHLADQALVLAGPVRGVYAEVHHRGGPGGLDDDVFIALTHESGVQTHLWGSWWQGAPGPRIRAAGTAGAYVIQDVDGQEAQLRAGASPASVGQNAGHGEQWGAVPPERWGYLHRGDSSEPVPSARGAWDLFYPAFAAAVRGAQPVPVNPWDAVATAAVLDAARASAAASRIVTPAPAS